MSDAWTSYRASREGSDRCAECGAVLVEDDGYRVCSALVGGEVPAAHRLIPTSDARMAHREALLVDALRAIRGPEHSGPWMLTYRNAGGGYEGLQAIAAAALEADGRDVDLLATLNTLLNMTVVCERDPRLSEPGYEQVALAVRDAATSFLRALSGWPA